MRLIAHRGEVQSGSRKGRCRQASITTGQQLGDPFRGMLPLTDGNKAADEITHHVVKEGRGLEIKDDEIVKTADLAPSGNVRLLVS